MKEFLSKIFGRQKKEVDRGQPIHETGRPQQDILPKVKQGQSSGVKSSSSGKVQGRPVEERRRRVEDQPAESNNFQKGTLWDNSQFVVPPVEGKKRFIDFDLPVEVMHAISDLDFKYCTPIQAGILPKLLEGLDAAGRAQTGTGKTAAFLISIITFLLRNPLKQPNHKAPRALILAPTRELVLQIKKDADGLSKYSGLQVAAVLGGIEYKQQKDILAAERIDIVVATPGRLLDFKRQGSIRLDKVEVLVIDEADRMLDMGFIPDVRQIIESTPPKTKRHTMLFSATLTPEVNRLASRWTREPSIVEIEPEQVVVKTIKQIFYLTTDLEKFKILYNLVAVRGLQRVMVFANRKDIARDLKDRLASHGINCALLSGDVEQGRRIKRLENFRSGQIKVLVATDVAARGIHVEGISHVVNFTLPENPEDYVHRIGRTGRAGASGISISFATETDSYSLPAIKKYLGEEIKSVYPEDDLLTPLPEPKFALQVSGPPRRRYQRGGSHEQKNRRSSFKKRT
ncbi:MAG: DEAD/DEAH box helicase [Candidatus Kryptoniota bacterium]